MVILFIISVLFIIHVINIEKNKDESLVFNGRTYPWIITSIISALIIFTFAHLDTNPAENNNQVDEKHHQHH
jgi:hypothetical protein